VASYSTALYQQPVSFSEGWVNAKTRVALETQLAKELRHLPSQASILMYLGEHPGALQQAGIPIRRIIYEGNHRAWKQPTDPDGLWEKALANPSQYADYVVAMERDAVDTGANKRNLTSLVIIHVLGQPQATIYRVNKP
jgi:hypothetical protein